jgi:phosphoglycolate phosphatase
MKPVICFDWDGTLCDSMELCINENRTTLLRMGLPDLPDETLRRCNGPTFEEAAPIIGIPPERMEEYCRIRLSCALELVPKVNRLFPGARELLAALAPHAELCIVSTGTPEYLGLCLQVFGMEDVFSHVVTCHPERTKGQNLALLLEQLPQDKARVVMVGDRLGDIRAGKENGLTTVAAAFGYGSAEEFTQADAIAPTMAELQQMLLRFCTQA